MAEINREKAIRGLEISIISDTDAGFSTIEIPVQQAENILALLKEQDAIVRCKDCKHSCDYTDIFPNRAYNCTKNGGFHNDSWFCADGERNS